MADYLRRWRPRCKGERAWYGSAPDLAAAIARAAESIREDGTMESHQRRVGRVRLRRFRDRLMARKKDIAACRSFRDLYDVLWSCRTEKIGALAVYDIAIRIGAFMRLAPAEVFVHAGVREGARALGLRVVGGVVQRADLSLELRRLPCDAVEDFLCIYKRRLLGVRRS